MGGRGILYVMRIRFRLLAALLALVALTSSLVGEAWAVACMGMDGSPARTAAAHDAGAAHSSDAHDTSAPDGHRSHSPSDPASCPMAAASGMACGVAALPVDAPPAPLGAEVHVAVPPAADEAPGSLALSSLFRPPRR